MIRSSCVIVYVFCTFIQHRRNPLKYLLKTTEKTLYENLAVKGIGNIFQTVWCFLAALLHLPSAPQVMHLLLASLVNSLAPQQN